MRRSRTSPTTRASVDGRRRFVASSTVSIPAFTRPSKSTPSAGPATIGRQPRARSPRPRSATCWGPPPGRVDTRSSRIGPVGGAIARPRTARLSPPPAGALPDQAVFQDERVELAAYAGLVLLDRRGYHLP